MISMLDVCLSDWQMRVVLGQGHSQGVGIVLDNYSMIDYKTI